MGRHVSELLLRDGPSGAVSVCFVNYFGRDVGMPKPIHVSLAPSRRVCLQKYSRGLAQFRGSGVPSDSLFLKDPRMGCWTRSSPYTDCNSKVYDPLGEHECEPDGGLQALQWDGSRI